MNKMNYLVVPVVTELTLTNLKKYLEDIPIIDKPLIKTVVNEYKLIESIEILKKISEPHIYFSIFTSKNAVNLLLEHLKSSNELDNVRWIFSKVLCIGEATLEILLREIKPSDIHPISIKVSGTNNTRGLLNLLSKQEGRPMLWCSRYVNKELKKYIKKKKGITIDFYTLKLHKPNLRWVLKKLDKHLFYLIFMSKTSTKIMKYIPHNKQRKIIAIFLSKRIYQNVNTSYLLKHYIYEGEKLEKFYNFLREVII